MKEKLLELIPEFNLIQDENLRNKVIGVWIDAMEAGKWEIVDLKTMPFTLLLENCPANFIQHTRGVAKLSYQAGLIINELYADRIKINMDYLVAGGILHDVGKLLEYTKKDGKVVKSPNGKLLRHPFSGMGIAFGKGLPDEVLHMIATHAKEGDMGSRIPESVLIHHADFSNFEIFK